MKASLREEKKLWKKGFKFVLGFDEAGRGALAGPVVAAVTFIKDRKLKIKNLRDSKKLSPKKRKEIFEILKNCKKIEWGIGKVSEKIIDKIGILKATKLAMKRAFENLKKKLKKRKIFLNRKNTFLILDGNFKIDLPFSQKSIVKGDEKVFSCALASIFAKVKRDKIMERASKKFPEYGFELNKGYLTKFHQKMLKKYGPSLIHRKSFFPVKYSKAKTMTFGISFTKSST